MPSTKKTRARIRTAANRAAGRAKIARRSHAMPAREPKMRIERIQLGVRLEKRLAKVLKGIAEYCDLSLAEMLEEIVLHAFEGASTFGPNARRKIAELKTVYELDYDVHASFRFSE